MRLLMLRFASLSCIGLGLLLLTLSQLPGVGASATHGSQPHAAHLTVDGSIGPATTDYLRRSMRDARAQGAQVMIVQLDTPGGLVSTTRDIVSDFLDSDIPIVTWVAPQGARAASAGTFILYGSHVAAMAPSTHLGAATPVQMQGGENGDSAMERKLTNDAIAYLKSLAERYDRNAEWAELAVRDAATLTAREALEENVIEFIASDIESLLSAMDGHEVLLRDSTYTLATDGLEVRQYERDWRNQVLDVLTNPQLAYLLLLVGVYGIIFELMSPGALFPGITGVIALLLAAFSLQILPINIVGLLLIIVGAILIVVEAFVPSFGVIGVGGVIALMAGSLMLFDGSVPGMELPMNIIITVGILALLSVAFVVLVVARSAWRERKPSDRDAVGEEGQVVENLNPEGLIRLGNEIWPAHAQKPRLITHGKKVRVVSQEGTLVYVEEIKKTEQRPDAARFSKRT